MAEPGWLLARPSGTSHRGGRFGDSTPRSTSLRLRWNSTLDSRLSTRLDSVRHFDWVALLFLDVSMTLVFGCEHTTLETDNVLILMPIVDADVDV